MRSDKGRSNKQIEVLRTCMIVDDAEPYVVESLNMAVEALEQDLCDDCISRSSIKQKLQEHHDFFVKAYGGFSNLPQNDKSRVDEITNCIAMVVNEPSVHPECTEDYCPADFKSIECEDCVSRKALLKIYDNRFLELQKIKHLKENKGAEDRQMGVNYCINILKEMPPVTPAEKVGHWIPYIPNYDTEIEYYVCSECKNRCMGKTRFCFDCGCKMQEVGE